MNKTRGVLLLLVFICVATALLNDKFVGDTNLQRVMARSARFGIISVGVAFVIITGGIDLSIGSVIGLTGCILAMLIEGGVSDSLSILIVIILSLLIGLLHGLLITKVKLQPFIVTLCGLLVYRGIARWIAADDTHGFGTAHEDTLMLLAKGKPCSMAFAIMVAGFLVFLVSALKWRIASKKEEREKRSLLLPGLTIAGFLFMLIGSSRYWFGISSSYTFDFNNNWLYEIIRWGAGVSPAGNDPTVPPMGTILPGTLLWAVGLLALPASLWFWGLSFRSDKRKTIFPTVALLLASGLILAAAHAVSLKEDPSSYWLGNGLRLALVFSSLAFLFAALLWMGRVGLSCGGPAARLPLAIASTSFLCLLIGHNAYLDQETLHWHLFQTDLNFEWIAGKTSFTNLAIPVPFFVLVMIATTASLFLNRTIYGRYMLALGRNEEAARYSGISTDRMKILAYVICAMTAGIGSILFTLDGNSVQPSGHGNYFELYAIAAAVLGGCSLRGGEGSILAVVIGAAVIRLIYNSIGLIGIPSQLEFAILGMVILTGAIVDEYIGRMSIRRQAAERAAQDTLAA